MTLDRKVTFEVWGYTQDLGSGTTSEVTASWNQYAKVVTSSGNQFGGEAMQQWQYDVKVTVRKLVLIKSSYTFQYAGERYTINSIKVNNEGRQSYYEITATKTDGNV